MNLRRILNLLVTGLILWLASLLFPDVVQIDGGLTLVAATILLWLLDLAVAWGSAVFGLLIAALLRSAELAIVTVVMILSSQVIALYIMSGNLSGFVVAGFWPKVLLAICISTVSSGLSNKTSNNN